MMPRIRADLMALGLLVSTAAWPLSAPETRPAEITVEGVWKLEKIVRSTGAVDTAGGFIFQAGYYSATVNYSQAGTQTNISQFGSYTVEGGRLTLIPTVHISARGQTIIYDPEPPFTLEVTLIGDEMKGIVIKDGTTFLFRRLR